MQPPTIRGIEQRDIPQLADTLAQSFNNDPCMRWATREDEKRLPALRDFFTFCLESDLHHGWETTTDDLQACAVWIPPNDEKTHPLYTLRMLPRYIKWCGVKRLGRWHKFGELCQQKRPKTPHYYLDFIGVNPTKQGQGYASTLLKHTLTILDKQGSLAYLESSNPRNNPLYQRTGFEITDEIHLPDGPTLWCMWRKPMNNAT